LTHIVTIFITVLQIIKIKPFDLRSSYAYCEFMGLTPKQKKVLEYIQSFQRKNGLSPTQAEIAKHFKFSSLGTVQNYMVRLTRNGFLEKEWNEKRSLKIISTREFSSTPTTNKLPSSSQPHMKNTHHEDMMELPLLGRVAAGRPIEAIRSDESITVPRKIASRNECFALRVVGDSMIEDGIFDGDVVIIQKQTTANNGETVVALIDNEATIKVYQKKNGRIELLPANPNYKPIVVKDDRSFEIHGKLVGLYRKY
jgi:repressor LexA